MGLGRGSARQGKLWAVTELGTAGQVWPGGWNAQGQDTLLLWLPTGSPVSPALQADGNQAPWKQPHQVHGRARAGCVSALSYAPFVLPSPKVSPEQ